MYCQPLISQILNITLNQVFNNSSYHQHAAKRLFMSQPTINSLSMRIARLICHLDTSRLTLSKQIAVAVSFLKVRV